MTRAQGRARARARARRTDPAASHEAAERVDLKATQAAVMVIFRTVGVPLLDEELVEVYERRRKSLLLPLQSASGLRSRRSELAKMTPPKLLQGPARRCRPTAPGLPGISRLRGPRTTRAKRRRSRLGLALCRTMSARTLVETDLTLHTWPPKDEPVACSR